MRFKIAGVDARHEWVHQQYGPKLKWYMTGVDETGATRKIELGSNPDKFFSPGQDLDLDLTGQNYQSANNGVYECAKKSRSNFAGGDGSNSGGDGSNSGGGGSNSGGGGGNSGGGYDKISFNDMAVIASACAEETQALANTMGCKEPASVFSTLFIAVMRGKNVEVPVVNARTQTPPQQQRPHAVPDIPGYRDSEVPF
jgi:hypothetical protein